MQNRWVHPINGQNLLHFVSVCVAKHQQARFGIFRTLGVNAIAACNAFNVGLDPLGTNGLQGLMCIDNSGNNLVKAVI